MPGDEQKNMNRADNHEGQPLSLGLCLYRKLTLTTTPRREINKIPECFSCPGDCKELSKKSK